MKRTESGFKDRNVEQQRQGKVMDFFVQANRLCSECAITKRKKGKKGTSGRSILPDL